MSVALLLVDLQNDYLDRSNLSPSRSELIDNTEVLLSLFREYCHPVIHIQTIISKDGCNRMPHWKKTNQWSCVEDTPGAESPSSLKCIEAEYLVSKPFYSAFDAAETEIILLANNIDTLIIAGVYTHACIRNTALDALAQGYNVIIASNAIASTEKEHARITLDYLKARTADLLSTKQIQNYLEKSTAPDLTNTLWQQRNPCNWNEVMGQVLISEKREVTLTVDNAHSRFLDSPWGPESQMAIRRSLARWLEIIILNKNSFLHYLVKEIAKPIADAHDEYDYAVTLLQYLINNIEHEHGNTRYRPLGVVGLITPWNNPLAISIGKIAPALAYGNTVVWKPALQVPNISDLLVKTLCEAGLGRHLYIIKGDKETGRLLAAHTDVKAVSLTGSIKAGRQVSAICAVNNKKFQGELGGNNPALILPDINVDQVAFELAQSMFSFSGQRCTALRRLIVSTEIKQEFELALVKAINMLNIGLPGDSSTQIGPLISKAAQDKMAALVSKSLTNGARLLCGGNISADNPEGCWFEPTIISDPDSASPVVTEEAFGPVAVLLEAKNIEHGITLCNAVPHALIAALFTNDKDYQNLFQNKIQAGIIVINTPRPTFDPSLPFTGWKSSSTGMPEHGRWDRDFYSQTQAVYSH